MTVSSPLEPAASTRALLRVGPVRNLLLSSAGVNAGVLLQATVLGKQVYDITGRELDIGLLGLAEFLPAALLVLVTGSVADRFNRKVVGALAILGELACSVALALYSFSEPTAVWPLFVIAVLFGTSRAFAAPAIRSIPPMVAPEGALPRTVALYSATWTSAAIVGPAAGGFVYSVEPGLAYVVAATVTGLGLTALLAIRLPERSVPDDAVPDVSADRATDNDKVSLHSALEGLRFIRRSPILLAAISLDLFAVLFGGAVALLPAIAEDRLQVGDVAYGWLRAAPGIGAAAMAMLLASRPVSRLVGRKLLYMVGLFGFMTIVLGVTTNYVIAFVALMVLSGADMVSVFIRGTLVPLVTPDDKRGRVTAVENVFIGASNELGAFESGVAAQAFGTQAAVVGGGVATVAIVGAWWVFFPALRDVDRFEDLDPKAENASRVT